MKLIALCGAAGAGKDTVADMLPARKLAFADTLYAEVAAAWGVEQHVLRCRETKEMPSYELCIGCCDDDAFAYWAKPQNRLAPRSPRQILQWWGDYRRAQDPDYFVRATRLLVDLWRIGGGHSVVITDVRFPNEAAMVRQLGGQIWQIRRPGYEAGGTGHASDTDGSEFAPDRVVVNDGTRAQLHSRVLDLWEGV